MLPVDCGCSSKWTCRRSVEASRRVERRTTLFQSSTFKIQNEILCCSPWSLHLLGRNACQFNLLRGPSEGPCGSDCGTKKRREFSMQPASRMRCRDRNHLCRMRTKAPPWEIWTLKFRAEPPRAKSAKCPPQWANSQNGIQI